MAQLRKVTQTKSISWTELQDIVDNLAEQIITREVPKNIVIHEYNSVIPGIMLAEALNATWTYQCGEGLTFAKHSLFGESDVCLFQFQYEDVAYQTFEPKYYYQTMLIEIDTQPADIYYPWKK